jgi:hypothetical protein
MHRLIYVSSAAMPMTDEGLTELLRVARSRNLASNITGMLIYSKAFFIQVLEGSKSGVDAVYASICRDRRHAAPYIMDESEIGSRSFPDWTMGFHKLSDDAGVAEPGFFDLLELRERAPGAAKRKDLAIRLLYAFTESE